MALEHDTCKLSFLTSVSAGFICSDASAGCPQAAVADGGDPNSGFLKKLSSCIVVVDNPLLSCPRSNVLDFDDLLSLMVALLRDGELASKFRGRYRWLLVDEFQDTNAPQYELVRLLGTPEVRKADAVADASLTHMVRFQEGTSRCRGDQCIRAAQLQLYSLRITCVADRRALASSVLASERVQVPVPGRFMQPGCLELCWHTARCRATHVCGWQPGTGDPQMALLARKRKPDGSRCFNELSLHTCCRAACLQWATRTRRFTGGAAPTPRKCPTPSWRTSQVRGRKPDPGQHRIRQAIRKQCCWHCVHVR